MPAPVNLRPCWGHAPAHADAWGTSAKRLLDAGVDGPGHELGWQRIRTKAIRRKGVVGLAVAAAIQPVAVGATRGGWDGGGDRHPGQGRPGGGLGVDQVELALSTPHAAVWPGNLDHRQPIGAHNRVTPPGSSQGDVSLQTQDRSRQPHDGHRCGLCLLLQCGVAVLTGHLLGLVWSTFGPHAIGTERFTTVSMPRGSGGQLAGHGWLGQSFHQRPDLGIGVASVAAQGTEVGQPALLCPATHRLWRHVEELGNLRCT